MKKISLTALSLLILTACATEPVTAYRWHRTGASEARSFPPNQYLQITSSKWNQTWQYIQNV